nr:MAG TPA: hypothetical protein [Caudoviricetes sp.]
MRLFSPKYKHSVSLLLMTIGRKKNMRSYCCCSMI